ncbi:MAG: ABC transporter ATP-binding protein [Clostridia bacterium]|nr:ABC transporter ATP-binding protein [Clostridia bacterium]
MTDNANSGEQKGNAGLRKKFRLWRLARQGRVPDEIKGTPEEKLLKKKIKQNKNLKKGWGLFIEFIRRHWVRYSFGVLAIVSVNAMSIVTPIITGDIVDMLSDTAAGMESVSLKRLSMLCLVIVGLSFAKLMANFFNRYLIQGASNILEYAMRKRMFNKLIDLSISYFNRKSAGEIMALASNDLRALRHAVGHGIMMLTNALVLLGAGFIYLTVRLSLPLTLAIMIPFPFMLLLINGFSRFIQARFKRVQETFADLSSKVEENISGIRVIKSFVQEEQEIANFRKINESNYDASIKHARVMAIFHPSLSFISTMSYLIMLMAGGLMAMQGAISLGEFVAANTFIGMLIRPISFLGMLINQMQQGKVSLTRIGELIFENPDIFDGKFGTPPIESPGRLSGRIEFNNLRFKYPEKDGYILDGINTAIAPGTTVALVGEVGSGKTTFANLLMRIFDIEEKGMITIDGHDITDIPLKALRDNIGYVPQDNFLFSESIAYNIGFSEEGYPMEEIENAARKSNVYGNIMEFPEKFDTMLGEKGVNLSGGQKQRICIARALIKDAPILILDDCLSSVDVETEKEILANLRDVRAGRTCIIISHRVSTIKDADKIIVLENSRIAEEGSHDQLVALGGIYDKMYRMQLIDEIEINGGGAL